MTTAGIEPPDRAAEPYRLARWEAVPGDVRHGAALGDDGRLGAKARLEVRVFERTGEFGAGQAHSPAQARTSYLNRIACQVSFAADESTAARGRCGPAPGGPRCTNGAGARSGDRGAGLRPAPRGLAEAHVHGLALREMFRTYAADLLRHPAPNCTCTTRKWWTSSRSGAGSRWSPRPGTGTRRTMCCC